MKSIFLIKKLWIDSLENDLGDAYGYRCVGYVNTEAKAKKVIKSFGTINVDEFRHPLQYLAEKYAKNGETLDKVNRGIYEKLEMIKDKMPLDESKNA